VDAVAGGETGALVPVGDRRALAAALLAYLDDPGLRAAHGAAGRRRVELLFARRRVWGAWVELYRGELARRAPAVGSR
ncbi:MAG TPA: hypothetical protein VHM02_10115, partial [Thermoanaerobaculia bacterium]|nr:hypothetical protein [Thermoanaerobaculia bacterium]